MLYHVGCEDHKKDFRDAYSYSIGECIKNGSKEILIAVDDHETIDSKVYPVIYGIADKLKEFGFLAPGPVNIYLETRETKSNFRSGVIIASYLSESFLSEVLNDGRATDIIFVSDEQSKHRKFIASNQSHLVNS